MAFFRLFSRGAALRAQALALHGSLVQAARRPEFFGPERAPDTLEGRLEVLMLHGALLLERLRAEPGAERLAQLFTDRFFRALDEGLREAGVGDLTVPRKMRHLAERFYGRLNAYGTGLQAGDAAQLGAALLRILQPLGLHPGFAEPLAHYALAAKAVLAQQPVSALREPAVWPSPSTADGA